MLNIGDVLTIRFYPFGDDINKNKYRDVYYTDSLFLVCNYEDIINNSYYNVVELESGYSPWLSYGNLEELENKLNSLVEIIAIKRVK